MAKRVDTEFRASETVSKAAKKAAGGVTGLNKKVKDSAKVFRNSTIAIGAAVAGIYAVGRAVGELIETYKVQEQAEAKLAAAFRATGEASAATIEELTEYAAQLQQVTIFGDETTISAAAMLQSLSKLGKDGIKQILPLVQDLATGMDMDLNDAASLVGKTLGSTTNALSRYGIQIDATASQEVKLVQLTEELQSKFGGMSRTIADTATGAMEQFQNSMGDLKEAGGEAIANFLEPAVRWLREFVANTTEAIEKTNRLRELTAKSATEELGAKEEIEKVDLELEELERRRASLRARGAKTELQRVKDSIAAKEKERAQLEQLVYWENQLEIAKEEKDEVAAKEAEAELERQQELLAWKDRVLKKYGETEEAKRAELDAEIAWYEYWLPRSKVHETHIETILAMLYEQREALDGIAEAEKNLIPTYEILGKVLGDTVDEYQRLNEAEADKAAEEAWQARIDQAKEYVSIVSSIASSVSSIWDQINRNQEIAIENDYERRKEAIETNIQDEEEREAALEDLNKEFDKKRAAIQTKQARADKAGALLGAIVNTASAVAEALPNIPLSILAGALGTAQVALIAAQPIPKFAAGVRDFVVPPGYPNDSYPILVETGERVNVAPAAGGGSSEMIHNTIILDGRVIAEYITEAIRNRQIIVTAGSVRP